MEQKNRVIPHAPHESELHIIQILTSRDQSTIPKPIPQPINSIIAACLRPYITMSPSSLPNVTVIGSLNVDFVTVTPRHPAPGETLTATSFAVHGGGKGANQAVACGRASFATKTEQDVSVSMIGAVGARDPYYSSLLQPTLEKSGVSTHNVAELENVTTGSATIIVDANGQNCIMVVPGANHIGLSSASDILELMKEEPEVVVMQGEIPRQTVLHLLKHLNAPTCKSQVVFNPAPVYTDGIPAEALKDLAVLIVNETEALQLAQLTGFDVTGISEDDLPVEVLAKHFHEVIGVRIALLTLGAKGVFYSTRTGKIGMVAGVKVPKVVDTTAAGDTFVGYFSTAFAKFVAKAGTLDAFDSEIDAVVRRANGASAVCVQKEGAMQSVPFAYEI